MSVFPTSYYLSFAVAVLAIGIVVFQQLPMHDHNPPPLASTTSHNQDDDQPCLLGDGWPCQDLFTAGRLTPFHLPPPNVVLHFELTETVELVDGTSQGLAHHRVTQVNAAVTNQQQGGNSVLDAAYTVLPTIVPTDIVNRMRRLLQQQSVEFDDDPDSVDAMPSYEFVISNHFDNQTDSSSSQQQPSLKYRDTHPDNKMARQELRQQLRDLTLPILQDRITPLVRRQYPSLCANATTLKHRQCTPCYGMIRRYRHGERQSHAPHYDGHALITVVVSLSDYQTEYTGGLFVGTAFGQRQYLGLNRGDGVMHQSNLLHGVQVFDKQRQSATTAGDAPTERWSWILWYRDSDTCDDYGHEWFAECALQQHDPICLQLHSTKFMNDPDSSNMSRDDMIVKLVDYNVRAALGGSGTSAVKIARSYLKRLPTHLAYNETLAKQYFQIAIDSHHPDGHFGMASLLVYEVAKAEQPGQALSFERRTTWKTAQLSRVVWHLEQAAQMEHAYSMFNLGIAHTFGYGIANNKIDTMVARDWFLRSGLPEGYFVAAHQAQSVGDLQRHNEYMELAKRLGYFQPWRKEARERTGSGGAGGVELNLQWPLAHDGRRPPIF